MNAETVARELGGERAGQNWVACCPAHDDRRPSLSISDVNGKVLVHCHAGCDQRDVIAALKDRSLWFDGMPTRHRRASRQNKSDGQAHEQATDLSAYALRIWQSTLPASGTPVETYLASRGLTLPLPPSLRFHRGLKHPSGGFWPCMVANVTRATTDAPLAIHRTFLARDGKGKAPVDPRKMMLGPCRGGAVRLGPATNSLMIGEGIETCLAAMQATRHAAWAALSTSGLRTLDLPSSVNEVIILADGDDSGEAAARDCGLRWRRQGRQVRIARPPHGMDFNDLLLGSALVHEGDPR